MKFFLDTEFIEAGAGQPIDLISIGLLCEDGREYYAINIDYDFSRANDWVVKNVLSRLPNKPSSAEYRASARLGEDDFFKTRVGKEGWRSRQLIADEIVIFIDEDKPEFWGEWCSYDWVTFCQLFGDMASLPEGFPMRCRDVIQWAEDHLGIPSSELPPSLETEGNHNALLGARTVKERWEFLQRFEENRAMQRIKT